MRSVDRSREDLIELYRSKARRYDVVSHFSPVPGYPEAAQRRRAVRALGLHAGDLVVDVACGTGRSFARLEAAVGPAGRIVGVDLTDAMLARAKARVSAHGWSNVRLVNVDAAAFAFPADVDGIVSTYALTQVPECADVISHGAQALRPGGRWVVLDLQVPASAPMWVVQLGTGFLREFAAIDPWLERRPWEAIHTAMQRDLDDVSWTDLCFGTAFLAVGSRRS